MLKEIITKKILIVITIFGFSLCLIVLLLQVFVFPSIEIENESKVHIEITPLPDTIKTSYILDSKMDPIQPMETSVIPGVFALDMEIVISGTQDEGLNIRNGPGTDSPVVCLAWEGEKYKIIAGPEIKDGLIWWKIINSDNNEKTGWAVQDYFSPASP